MISLGTLKVIGIIAASIATLASVGTEGFYAWKVYEIDNVCSSFKNESDVCQYEELQVRSYVGLGEGIVGSCVSICLIVGFVFLNLPLIWIWVVWGLGIMSYNAYCIYDYYTMIDETIMSPGGFDWNTLVGESYSYFFIVAITSVCWYGLVLLMAIPVGATITHMIRPDYGIVASFELPERQRR
ncbi:hypothetical protein Pmani_024236 [Petrolisthes manimaculis]|uniref:Uncharacterized protein n=1 Tax=Petrolisthes manimaculis TaxID=1843537 RepID=A0AAE1TZJ5_9EUCA|nr:hypothetical protein Pmani_024236 [Petrolisthes manimaculis]